MITARPLYPIVRVVFGIFALLHVVAAGMLTSASKFSNPNAAYPEIAMTLTMVFLLAGIALCTKLRSEGARYIVMVCALYLGMAISVKLCSAPLVKFEPPSQSVQIEF